ncbi:MAG: hypothetical protein V1912_11940 [bacterium]
MEELPVDALRQAVEGLHSCRASFSRTELVHEQFQNQTAWEGIVHIFDLHGHETASVAYAWSEAVPGSDRRRFHAVLHAGPVYSAQDAVRAAIVSGYKEGA